MDTYKYIDTANVRNKLESEIKAEILSDMANIVNQARHAADLEDARAAVATLAQEEAAAGELFAELTARVKDLRAQHTAWRRELETMEDKREHGEVDPTEFRINHAKMTKTIKDVANEIRLVEVRARGAESLERTKKGKKVKHSVLARELEAMEFPETRAADILREWFTKKAR